MITVRATTAMAKIVDAAAGDTKVVLGERSHASTQTPEPKRPYFRIQFSRLDQPTEVPGRLRGVCQVSCFAKDYNAAWALGTALTRALGLTKRGIVSPGQPNAVSDYSLESAGWSKGADPQGGGMVFCSIAFHYGH